MALSPLNRAGIGGSDDFGISTQRGVGRQAEHVVDAVLLALGDPVEIVLEARGITAPDMFDGLDFQLHAGEILGCAALSEPGAGSDFAAIATRAEKVGDGWRLEGATVVVTVEPCPMCAGAIVHTHASRFMGAVCAILKM